MVQSGPAKKLTIYVDESERHHGKPVYEIVMDALFARKIAGVSVFRGVAGYGSDGVFHTAKILELATTLPVKIEAVDSENMINSVLPELTSIIEKGLIEVSDTMVIQCCTGKKTLRD
jgi:PII-like signaling protein